MSQPSEGLRVGRSVEVGGAAGAERQPLQAVEGSVAEVTDTPRDRAPAAGEDVPMPPGFVLEQSSVEELMQRLRRLERRLRLHFFVLALVVLTGGWVLVDDFLLEGVIVRQRLMESRELTLLDNDGNARLFLRMYSKVPVLQIMDSDGRPRMSMGLRFDDTPFIDLSDRRGRTRATMEMTEDDSPALRLFDENGTPIFNIN